MVDDYAESPYPSRRVTSSDILKPQLGLAEETIGFEKSYVSADRWEEIAATLLLAQGADCGQHESMPPKLGIILPLPWGREVGVKGKPIPHPLR